MRNDKVIYSYIEKRIIDSDSSKIKFDPNRHSEESSFTLGYLLKRILVYSFVIFIICSLVFYPNNKKTTKSFIDDTALVVTECNNIINTIAIEYNNNNFSNSYKSELQNKLIKLQNKDLSKYKDSKYNALIVTINSLINETTDSVNIILESNSSDTYTSGALNSNIKSIRNDFDTYKASLLKFFNDNNIIYTVNDNGSYSYQL